MAEIRLEGVTKRYGKVTAVSEMSMTAHQGEFVVLVWAVGRGQDDHAQNDRRSGTARRRHDLLRRSLDEEVDTADRNVSMAFENYALYPHMSVFDNIAFPLKVPSSRGQYSKEDVKRRVKEIAQVLQIDMLLKRRPRS